MLVFPSRWRRPSAPRSLGPRVARVRRPRAARWATAAHVTPPIRRVMEHVEVHVGEVRTLDELAEVAGLSRFHFARRFRDETGEPPWAFVRRKRAEHARRLLEDGHAPAEVAFEAGYADQPHLTRDLRARLGTTPGALRGAAEANRDESKDVQDAAPVEA